MKFYATAIAVVIAAGAAWTEEPKVELKSAKVSDVKAAIAEQKGKVVVLDFWATY